MTIDAGNASSDANNSHYAVAIGADIKALRQTQDLSIAQLAARINRSVGWLSQIERGLSLIGLADLRMIAQVLNVRVSLFFGLHEETVQDEGERGIIVRKGSRRTLGHRGDGCIEELLSPNGSGALQVIYCAMQPGAEISSTNNINEKISGREEMIIVISGKFDIEIFGKRYTLGQGDTMICQGEPRLCRNPYDNVAEIHRIITPPCY